MRSLGVEDSAWDVLIVGDGSGTTWNNSCGWASVLIDKKLRLRKELHGAMNFGTSYLAELMPYVQALSWYVEGPGRNLLHEKLMISPAAAVKIHIITDSETVAKQGQGRANRRCGHYYWQMFEAIQESGFEIGWHHLGRTKLSLNCLCDYLAGTCRKSIDVVTAVTTPPGTTAYDFNPEAEVVEPTAGQ